MPQFYIMFYANFTILATQIGGHGTMPLLNTPLPRRSSPWPSPRNLQVLENALIFDLWKMCQVHEARQTLFCLGARQTTCEKKF